MPILRGGWVGSSTDLDGYEEKENLLLPPGFESLSESLWGLRYPGPYS